MKFLESLLNTLMLSLVELFYLVGLLIGVGFLLGVLEKYSNKFLFKTFGPRGVLATAWIGTPIHELGHLLQCYIWGHRVTRVKFLQLNSPSGVLGYVEHQYNPGNIYQQIGNFFIGMGPIFSGIGVLIIGMYLLVPESYQTFREYIVVHISTDVQDSNDLMVIGRAVLAITKSLFTIENMLNPLFWIFLVLAISISSHIALSRADINGSAKGLLMIFFVSFITNLVTSFFGIDTYVFITRLTEYNAYVLAFSSIAILFSIITLLISYVLYKLKTGW
ncbi:hypothetical protein [Neobacillus niacini]|uniref:hypothetical protein n=1 Tax=Neobacillus niacini TaxID=86668 RepID=UPI0005EE1457|nr:hypothetical protein [Neobacillus niacini]